LLQDLFGQMLYRSMPLLILCRQGLLRVGDRRVSRKDIHDLARAKQLPDAIIQAREKQAPAIPLERYVRADEDAEAARVHISDPAHIDHERGGLILAHGIAKLKSRLGIQNALKHHDFFAGAVTIEDLHPEFVVSHTSVECITMR
jgi:hypothetical protein